MEIFEKAKIDIKHMTRSGSFW